MHDRAAPVPRESVAGGWLAHLVVQSVREGYRSGPCRPRPAREKVESLERQISRAIRLLLSRQSVQSTAAEIGEKIGGETDAAAPLSPGQDLLDAIQCDGDARAAVFEGRSAAGRSGASEALSHRNGTHPALPHTRARVASCTAPAEPCGAPQCRR